MQKRHKFQASQSETLRNGGKMTDIYVDKQYRYQREREPLISKIVEGIILSFAIMGMFIGLQ